MSKMRRYTITGYDEGRAYVSEDVEGDWVKHEDAQEQITELREHIAQHVKTASDRIAELEKELQRYRFKEYPRGGGPW